MKYIDLTHEIKEGIPCFGANWHIDFNQEQLGRVSEVGRNTSKLTIGSHCATHVDSPNHFYEDGITIEKIPLEVLCGPVTIIDLSFIKDGAAVTVDMINKFQFEKRVVFVFGWYKKWYSGEFYSNYPYFTKEATQYIINQGVQLVGMDTPSPDDSKTKLLSPDDSAIHKLFLSNGIILCEYLNNTDKIDFSKKYNLIALPLKIKCDGAPARIILQEL